MFNELQRMTVQEPKTLRIIKVKNKLKKVTKDILINLIFHDKIIVEVQLAVKSNRTKFIENSDKFNHFIYELERSNFGAVMELAKIWMTTDGRA